MSFYFTTDQYIIGDAHDILQSERTIDIDIFDLGNNEKLLNELNLYYMKGNYGVTYNYATRGQWFRGYLKALGQLRFDIVNTKVRILITDEVLLKKINNILSIDIN